MPDSIPQWITDIESDESIFKKKRRRWRAGLLSLLVVYFIGALLVSNYYGFYFPIFLIVMIVFFVILFFINLGIKKPNLPNLLAANLYHIGAELEAFNASSPSYIKRNQEYLKNCQSIIDDLIINRDYFIDNYIKFLENLKIMIKRLNNFYSKNSRPDNVSISADLKALAESIHDDSKNLKPVHTAYVDGILSYLQNVEALALDIPPINRLYNSFTTGWYNISYSYRAIVTLLVIEIIIFAIMSIVLIYVLGVDKIQSYGIAFGASTVLIGGLITQIDKIVPREKIRFS